MRLNLSLHLLFVVMTFNPNVVDATDESSPGLRGSNKRDHFSNDDATINGPMSFELLGFNEEDPNVDVATDESSPGLRGRSLMTRDHLSNDDLTINSPISYELLNFNEEARKVAKFELQEAIEAEYEHDVIEVLASTVINEAGLRSTEVVDEDVVKDVDFFHDLD